VLDEFRIRVTVASGDLQREPKDVAFVPDHRERPHPDDSAANIFHRD
jgi:hypothetical protein